MSRSKATARLSFITAAVGISDASTDDKCRALASYWDVGRRDVIQGGWASLWEITQHHQIAPPEGERKRERGASCDSSPPSTLPLPSTLLRLVWNERNRHSGTFSCSAQTIRQRIKETALQSRRMRKVQRLSPANVASRERWAMQRVHWRMQQW